MKPRVAVYSPAKAPDDPSPSGERTIVRAVLAALDRAGFDAVTPSSLRVLDKLGDLAVQSNLMAQAKEEVTRIVDTWGIDPPAIWLTYHSYYKAPDLLGPQVSKALGLPYAIIQPSLSSRRLSGPWAGYAHANALAIGSAELLFWSTARDLPALREVGLDDRLVHLPPFLGAALPPARRRATPATPQFATVAMMREGDKKESFLRLARALRHLPSPWRLEITGDGPARSAIEDAFADSPGDIAFLGVREPDQLDGIYDRADLLLWPGVGEGVGMTYLEAQSRGLPVIAEDHPAQRDIVAGPLAPANDSPAYAEAIKQALADLPERSATARTHVEAAHSLDAAAKVLGTHLRALL